ncbi:MAG: peptidase M75 [Paludibacter sp.]|nr:peptidase M75 [Paludibacter sp.]
MNKSKFFLGMAVVFTAVGFTACDKSGTEGTEDGYGYDFKAVINTYVDDVVLNTYTDMKDKATILYEAVEVYKANPSVGLTNVCAAWRTMRIPWEQSEGFLFGPAALLSLDPSLDSWPLDKTQLQSIIDSNIEISLDAIASSNVHGFHTIEYLIFKDGEPRTTALTDRELKYLIAATEYLRNDTYLLWANWVGASNITDTKVLAAFKENETDVKYNFSEQFKKAGAAGSIFLSESDAIDQIIDGCIDIASEVGAQKIGGPNATAKQGNLEQAVLDVESWYSWNSTDDYANNIISIRNSYFGGRGKTAATASANSISAFVKSKNAGLNIEVGTAIETAYEAIKAMTYPFRNNLTGAKVDAAIDACGDLELTLAKIKTLKD